MRAGCQYHQPENIDILITVRALLEVKWKVTGENILRCLESSERGARAIEQQVRRLNNAADGKWFASDCNGHELRKVNEMRQSLSFVGFRLVGPRKLTRLHIVTGKARGTRNGSGNSYGCGDFTLEVDKPRNPTEMILWMESRGLEHPALDKWNRRSIIKTALAAYHNRGRPPVDGWRRTIKGSFEDMWTGSEKARWFVKK